jgi:conjugal transfer pilus assembly protein TraW
LLSAGVVAQILSPEDQAILDRSRQIMEQAVQGQAGPAPEIAASPATPTAAPQFQLNIYVSRSLPDHELRGLFAAVAGRAEVRIVLRGVRPGERLPAFLRNVQALLAGLDPPPNVALDPLAFRTARIESVPVLVLIEQGQPVARVGGTLAVDWFQREVAAGRRGDFGYYGPTRAIVEPDLVEELSRRAAALDGAALKPRALARYWPRVGFVELPEVTEARVRQVDPTVPVTTDLQAPDGRWIARAGDRFNPLAVLPFTTRLVVFDATRPAQVAVAQAAGQGLGGRRVIYLTTRLDRARGWLALDEVETRLGQPVYLLDAHLAERFQLQRVPAVVEAAGQRLVIQEIVP